MKIPTGKRNTSKTTMTQVDHESNNHDKDDYDNENRNKADNFLCTGDIVRTQVELFSCT